MVPSALDEADPATLACIPDSPSDARNNDKIVSQRNSQQLEGILSHTLLELPLTSFKSLKLFERFADDMVLGDRLDEIDSICGFVFEVPIFLGVD